VVFRTARNRLKDDPEKKARASQRRGSVIIRDWNLDQLRDYGRRERGTGVNGLPFRLITGYLGEDREEVTKN